MKKNILLINVFTLFTLTAMCLCLTSCGGGDDDGSHKTTEYSSGGGLTGWYADLSNVAKASDFTEINKAIENDEVLYRNNVASYDLFIYNDGLWWDVEWSHGRFRFYLTNKGKTNLEVIHIIDDNSLAIYYADLCAKGSKAIINYGEAIYEFYAGYIFKNMAYYGKPSYYTYSKIDNKIYIPLKGEIYTITSGGFVADGSSSVLKKYDPTKTY
ncbi:MAG: hypothetical protein IJ183_06070 [Prevotella sp.]|nr:hypothetical protein [Prevotella sp.]MBQ9237456.1 hypothetical protein [Prevotella sp.]MBQ9561105.1 hypothetical protein [Prevotella sp.]